MDGSAQVNWTKYTRLDLTKIGCNLYISWDNDRLRFVKDHLLGFQDRRQTKIIIITKRLEIERPKLTTVVSKENSTHWIVKDKFLKS